MPPSKPKPAEIASEAKKTYIPYIRNNCSQQWPPTSYLCYSETMPAQPPQPKDMLHCRFGMSPTLSLVKGCFKAYFSRVAFYERDPIDLALDWVEPNAPIAIPVIMPANEKRPGGDWEAGVMAPEECLCRRSNLFATLTTPAAGNSSSTNYPIPTKAGIYSEKVVVFRNGPERYEPWSEMKALPIISVCPVKRPKLDSSGKKYSFKQEKELMRDKIRTALRIAVYYGHTKICIGTFGLGPGFRNPPEEVALMWRDAFLRDPEFVGHFEDVIFAFDAPEGLSTSASSKSSSSKSSSKSSPSTKSAVAADLEIFRQLFKPSVIHDAFKNGYPYSSPPSTSSSLS